MKRTLNRRADSSKAQREWIWAFTKGERGRYLLLTVGDSISAMMYVAYALLTRELIDAAVARDGHRVLIFAAWLLGQVLVSTGLYLWMRQLTLDLRRCLEMRLRARLFRSLMNKECAATSQFHSGALQDRLFTDVSIVTSNLVDLLPDLASMLFGTLAALLSLYWLSQWIPLILVLMGVFFVLVRRLFKGRIKAYQARMRDAESDRRAYYQEALENLLILKVFGAEKAAGERGDAYERKEYRVWRQWYGYKQLLSGGVGLFFSLGQLGAMTLCAFLIMGDRMTYGSMTALLQLVAQVQSPFSDSFTQATAYAAMLNSAERLMELERLPDESMPVERDCEDMYQRMRAIRLFDLTYGYHEKSLVLSGASCELRKGDFLMITGESGAGKSTLMKLMLGVYVPTKGEVFLETQDGARLVLDAGTRALFAYVPQGNLLFSGTIRDNLTFLCGEKSDEALHEALRIACADDFVNASANGLDTLLEENGRGLSEGQTQRLAIARALLSDAPVLLLDEATSALDEETETRMLHHLRALPGKTVLLISHRRAAADVCNREWRLQNGAIEERELTSA